MSLNDLVTSTVSSDGAALKQQGFGIMLLAAYHTAFPELARVYEELSELVADGFAATTPVYKMASRVFSQEPRPPSVIVGRLATAYTQVYHWTPTITALGYVHKLTLESQGVTGTATVTNVLTTIDSVGEIVAAMVVAIQAINAFDTLLTVTEDGAKVIITLAAPGKLLWVSNWTEKLEDVTPDPGITTDLDNILLYNSDWYGVVTDINANAIQKKAADWVETNKKLGAWQTSDWEAADSAQTTDLGDVLQGLSYARSITYYDPINTGSYMAVGGMAERFPHDPGQPPGAGGTWHGKTIKGVAATNLPGSAKANLRAKNYVTYILTAGRSHTLDGKTSSGEYADVTRLIDWVNATIQVDVATLELDADKVPYTDGGISQVGSKVLGVMTRAVNSGGFSPNPYPTVTVPKAADVSHSDKANRVLNGVRWQATLAGAIHLSKISGTLVL